MNAMSTVRLAVVQVGTRPGQSGVNRLRATGFVERAATEGAELVVLPEMYSCGYLPNRAAWAAAEPADGPTEVWLAATARRFGIYVGAGTAETDGVDFFNVFVLAGPDGRVLARVYKANAEAGVFRRGRREHVVDTDLGRIGIGICADNQFVRHLRLMHEARVDVILMPHAWPTPVRAAGLVSAADVAAQQRRMIELPALYACALGVPVAFANQVGPLEPIGGILGRLMDPAVWRLQGQSRIVDSDGTVLGALSDQEGVLTATARMNPGLWHYREPSGYGGWLQPGSAVARRVVIPLDIGAGRLSYALSRRRRRLARARATGTPATTGTGTRP
jgi:N-carbamoylputrescine amidase